jgi:hypothetical protein
MHSLPQIVPNLEIKLDHLAITQAMFPGRAMDPDWAERVLAIVDAIQPTLTPEAVCQWFEPAELGENELMLRGPQSLRTYTLRMGEHARELAAASMVLCCVATLGEGFDRSLRQLQGSGDMLAGYLADCAGIYGLLQVSRAVYHEVEAVAAENSWGVGRVLCPGAIEGWSLEEQHQLCSLLPIEQCGVSLNEYGVLSPGKSVSFVLGIGPGYEAEQVESPCDICTNTGECWCHC